MRWGLGVFRRHPRLGRGAPGRNVRCSPASAPARGPARHPATLPPGGWVDGRTDGWVGGWTDTPPPPPQLPIVPSGTPAAGGTACAAPERSRRRRARCGPVSPQRAGPVAAARAPGAAPGRVAPSGHTAYLALLQLGAMGKGTYIKNWFRFSALSPPFWGVRKHGGEGNALLSQLGVAGVTQNRLICTPLHKYFPREFLIHLVESVSVGD